MAELNVGAERINCSFVSEKVAKIRFVQEKYKQIDTFVTGGWGSDTNAIGLWKLAKDELTHDDNDFDCTPKSIAKVATDGDVTGLEFLNSESIVCSTSSNNGWSRSFVHTPAPQQCANLLPGCRCSSNFIALTGPKCDEWNAHRQASHREFAQVLGRFAGNLLGDIGARDEYCHSRWGWQVNVLFWCVDKHENFND